jgi:hypothetical protein
MFLILGSRRLHVRSFLESATILRIHLCGFKVFFDVSSAVAQPQLVVDPYWTGVAPLAAYSVAATSDVSANSTD